MRAGGQVNWLQDGVLWFCSLLNSWQIMRTEVMFEKMWMGKNAEVFIYFWTTIRHTEMYMGVGEDIIWTVKCK